MGKQGGRSESPQPHPHPRARRHPENTLSSLSGDLCSGPLCVKTYKHISEHKHVNPCSNTRAHPGINAGDTQELTPTHTSTHTCSRPSFQAEKTDTTCPDPWSPEKVRPGLWAPLPESQKARQPAFTEPDPRRWDVYGNELSFGSANAALPSQPSEALWAHRGVEDRAP